MGEKERLLLHVSFEDSVNGVHAAGDSRGVVDERGISPTFQADCVRKGAHFGRNTCVLYRVDKNFSRHEGTVMMWFKPDFGADIGEFEDKLGCILWDLRIEHGSVTPDDPSQRWALVYRVPDRCWRFCLATNRNRYIIGSTQRRPDERTRQRVFSSQQDFKAGQWMHLAVTWTGDAGAVFVNGREDAREHLTEGLPTKPLPEIMQIGAVPSWINAGPAGVISGFRVYGRALNEMCIAEIIGDRPT